MNAAIRFLLFVTVLGLAAGGSSCRRTRDAANAGAPARVSGRVVLMGQATPPSVRVELRREGVDEPVKAQTLTPADGAREAAFALADVPPGRYTLSAHASGRAPAEVVLAVRPGEGLTTVLRLENAHSLRGTVVDGRDQPVAEARIYVWTSTRDRLPARETVSAADGSFEIADLAPGAVSLLIQTAGLGALQMDRVAVPAAPLRLQVEGVGRSITGEIVEDGRPVAHARVVLGGDNLAALRETRSDAQGRFAFPGVGEGGYDLRAASDRRASAVTHVELAPAPGPPPPLRLALEPGEVVTGRVVDHLGKAVPMVEVVVRAVPSNDCPESVRSDVVGYFSTGPLAKGRYQVVVSAAGHLAPPARTLDLRGPGPPLRLVLQPAAVVSGRVIGPDRRPVAGAEVTLEAALDELVPRLPRDRVPVLSGALPLAAEAASLPARSVVRGAQSFARAQSDGAGRFVLENVSPGRARVRVEHPRAVTALGDARDIPAGARVDVGDIALAAGGVVMGSVVDEGGVGLADVPVIVSRQKHQRGGAHETVSNADGVFELRIAEGSYWVWPERPGSVPFDPIAIDVDMNHAPTPLSLRLRSAAATPRTGPAGGIEGEVVDVRGRFVAGATVEVRTTDGRPGPTVERSGAGFLALGLAPGPWTVVAQAPGYRQGEVKIDVGPGESPRKPSVVGVRVTLAPVP